MSEQDDSVERPAQKPISQFEKAAGTFYKPSRVFNSITTAGVKFLDWFAPLVLVLLVAGVSSYVQLNTPTLRAQIVQQREEAIEKAESKGEITTQQADEERQMIADNLTSASAFAVVLRIMTVTVVLLIEFFLMSLVWFLVGRFALNSDFDYAKGLALTGMSYWITGVGLIFAIVIAVLSSRLDGGAHLGMLIPMNSKNLAYSILSRLNLFTIWSLIVISIGIGTLSGKKKLTAAFWVFGIWFVWEAVSIFFEHAIFS